MNGNVRKEPGERVHVQQGLGYAVRLRTLSTGLQWKGPQSQNFVSNLPGMEFGLSEGMECLFTHILIQWIIIVSRTTYSVGRLHENNNL